ncbi:MAG TPA: hypothetical protein VIM05_00795 [Gaiellaceae bacterium]
MASKKSKRPATVLEVCVARLGVHRGALAAANVAQWAMATRDLGHVPTTVEYAEYWSISERNGWLHRSRIRAALGDEWPVVVEKLAAYVGDIRSPRAAMKLRAPLVVA